MKKNFLLILVLIPFLAVIFLFPWAPEAQAAIVQCGGRGQAACTFCDFFILIHNAIEFALFNLGPVLVALMIMIGGFYILTGAGNPAQVAKGKNTVQWAILGYVLMMAAWLIVNTIFMVIDLNTSWAGLGKWYEINCY
ncbi:MAG: hypothetical protein A2919_00420 [Candidatus Spechtbacteria bacterium RIFCSPLOWO2_01_FULL_43_12]|uniref:Uncharacterized protein n=1 Tax=Candidatus Spechtbacteria bacterium RIFCSPLOWO2_01_FULL_43_12 TaxID=1802162 RepID=A0A1G2HEP3_9BACT|nr:MAG: hypothetical protein A2919_00420 [Candidatus Spechtbacteria bacterium RIFCSPLOWO2_01_FULL_43_12]